MSAEVNDTGLGLSNKEVRWRGTPIGDLPKVYGRDMFPPVVESTQHTILFKLPVLEGEVPVPWPGVPVDMWDEHHVRMPHSVYSLCSMSGEEQQSRWELVSQSLRTSIQTSQQLEAAILLYNPGERWNFKALHSFFTQAIGEQEAKGFFTDVLPKIVELALNLPSLVTKPIPLLKQHNTHSISISQQQVSSLLANAFLCTFPLRKAPGKKSELSNYPDINFDRLFVGDRAEFKGKLGAIHEKLKCIINYFRRVTTKVPEGVVTYSRHYVPPSKLPLWSDQSVALQNLHVTDEGTIEDGGTGMLELDFADKYIGGKVLGYGCVQEEIRFVTYPELILARLFTEVLDDTEALIVRGCERFSTYKSYDKNFKWGGNAEDSTPRDSFGRRGCTVVAVDAKHFRSAKDQFTPDMINRELNKAYAGFSLGAGEGSEESVATGNWGCGVFRGDTHLKSLLQIMAASLSGRQLAYFTFGNKKLRDNLANMHTFLVQHQVTVGDLWKIITSYQPGGKKSDAFYKYIYGSVGETDEEPNPTRPLKRAGSQKLQKGKRRL